MTGIVEAVDSIKTHLETAFPNVNVFLVAPPDSHIRTLTGTHWNPYLVVSISGPYSARAERHLTGLGRNDLHEYYLVVEAVTSSGWDAVRVSGEVSNALIGFIPTGSSILEPNGGAGYSTRDQGVRPESYTQSVGFRFSTNVAS